MAMGAGPGHIPMSLAPPSPSTKKQEQQLAVTQDEKNRTIEKCYVGTSATK